MIRWRFGFGSLATRLVASILATALVALLALASVALSRSARVLAEQTEEVTRLSEDQFSQRLDVSARLARERLVEMLRDVQRRFAGMAQRADVRAAIASRNSVAIAQLLAVAIRPADLDGVLVLDRGLGIVGAHALDLDLLATAEAFQESALARTAADLLARNDRDDPRVAHLGLTLDEPLAKALGMGEDEGHVDVFVQPVFDDFGDVSAALVGFRRIRAAEPVLLGFHALTGTAVIVADAHQVSWAGTPPLDLPPASDGKAGLARIDHGRTVARCAGAADALRVCALAPVTELHRVGRQVLEIGNANRAELRASLLWAVLLSIAALGATCYAIARHVTSPLRLITAAATTVARGDWTAPVPGGERRDEVGGLARAVLVLRDVLRERVRLRADIVRSRDDLIVRKGELREQNLRFDAALNNMSQALCMFDRTGRLIVCNRQLGGLYGLDAEAIVPGTTRDALTAMGLAVTDRSPEEGRSAGGLTRELPDGRVIGLTYRPMAGGGWIETHEDVTERARTDAQIAHLARHDILTGLPNRLLLREHLDELVRRTRATGAPLQVFCFDLDGFKLVNDTLGHAAGDELLREVAARLSRGAGPRALVFRLGGDEFALVRSPAAADDPLVLAGELVARVCETYTVEGQELRIGVCAGVAVHPGDELDAEGLFKRADVALYAAKKAGPNSRRLFRPELEAELRERRSLERDLHDALAADQLHLHYQPIVNLGTRDIIGFEALMRWSHPVRGSVSPAVFIPLAEDIGIIGELGRWALGRACAEATLWPHGLKVAVNVSPLQFRKGDFPGIVFSILAATRLPAYRLELEMTESVLLAQDTATMEALHRLRDFGVGLSLDDFGTGYSSLSCLRSFPFNKLKIDQSFIRNINTGAEHEAVLQFIGQLGTTLSMTTTAEGIEDEAQLAMVREHGICEGQGYLFSRPVAADRIPGLLASRGTPAGAVRAAAAAA